ncbi:MAG: hypothetical protein IBJ05_11380 [Blastomonas sp.]|nr:hypothetical protein [Blastomonas sp.]
MSDPVPAKQQDGARLSASVSFAALAKADKMMSRTVAAAAPSASLGEAEGSLEPAVSGAQTAEEAAISGNLRTHQDEGRAGLLMRGLQADPASGGNPSGSHTQSAPAAPVGSGAAGARADGRPPVELDSTIAQVIEIREALRSARPQMTLQHAEFGLVSLRLETSGAVQDWRAVLARRDPGFAPAFQAALAERALTASASTSSTSTGTGAGPNSGHGGFASQEQRYGFLPGSGQGSALPYLAQSGQRDDGTSQQHGQHHRRRDEAATAGPHEVGRSDEREQGLFA